MNMSCQNKLPRILPNKVLSSVNINATVSQKESICNSIKIALNCQNTPLIQPQSSNLGHIYKSVNLKPHLSIMAHMARLQKILPKEEITSHNDAAVCNSVINTPTSSNYLNSVSETNKATDFKEETNWEMLFPNTDKMDYIKKAKRRIQPVKSNNSLSHRPAKPIDVLCQEPNSKTFVSNATTCKKALHKPVVCLKTQTCVNSNVNISVKNIVSSGDIDTKYTSIYTLAKTSAPELQTVASNYKSLNKNLTLTCETEMSRNVILNNLQTQKCKCQTISSNLLSAPFTKKYQRILPKENIKTDGTSSSLLPNNYITNTSELQSCPSNNSSSALYVRVPHKRKYRKRSRRLFEHKVKTILPRPMALNNAIPDILNEFAACCKENGLINDRELPLHIDIHEVKSEPLNMEFNESLKVQELPTNKEFSKVIKDEFSNTNVEVNSKDLLFNSDITKQIKIEPTSTEDNKINLENIQAYAENDYIESIITKTNEDKSSALQFIQDTSNIKIEHEPLNLEATADEALELANKVISSIKMEPVPVDKEVYNDIPSETISINSPVSTIIFGQIVIPDTERHDSEISVSSTAINQERIADNKALNTVDYECQRCRQKFKTCRSLKIHNNRVHTSLKIYHCLFCNFRSFSNANLCQHVIKEHPSHIFRCSKCNFFSIEKKDLDGHICKAKKKRGRPIKRKLKSQFQTPNANQNNKNPLIQSKLYLNNQTYQNSCISAMDSKCNALKCTFCSFTCVTQSGFKYHLKSKHFDSIHRCPTCSFVTINEDDFSWHVCKLKKGINHGCSI